MWPECDLRTGTHLLEPTLETGGESMGYGKGPKVRERVLKNVHGLLRPTFFILCKRNQQLRGIGNGVRKKRGDKACSQDMAHIRVTSPSTISTPGHEAYSHFEGLPPCVFSTPDRCPAGPSGVAICPFLLLCKCAHPIYREAQR